MSMLYIANARVPSEKANGYQIAQMCEAFALVGESVKLVIPRRINTEAELRGVNDLWMYYNIRHNFEVVRIPCLDLIWLFDSKITFLLQTLTFTLALLVWLPFQRYTSIFTRDHFVMAVLSLVIPKRKLIYEVHNKFRSSRGLRLQSWLLRRVGKVVSLTGTMARQLENMGAKNVIVAHDGIRPERFENIPNLSQVRVGLSESLGIGFAEDAFIACYAGRLHTMNMSKGLDLFVEAASQIGDVVFLLVGGPDEQVEMLRQQWLKLHLPAENFIAVGSVPPAEVPRYLAAADVCLITSPRNEFFANETSPMKLFEYMLAGKAIIATDLPSTREVVTHGKSAYLIPPSDVDALANALQTLRDAPDLRAELGQQAKQDVMQYTWVARAKHILE